MTSNTHRRDDLLGAIVALVVLVSSIITFSVRILFDAPPGHWIGVPILLMSFPLAFLLFRAPAEGRPLLYYVQIGSMLVWIVVLFILDYVLGSDWRDEQWVVIPFVTLYFAGLGGMVGVASKAGRVWAVTSIVLFFVAAALAFIQRAVTGF